MPRSTENDFSNTTDITWECWVNIPSSGSSGNHLITQAIGAHIYIQDNKITWRLHSGGNSTQQNLVGSKTINGAGWTHVVCTYDGTTQVIYLNGVVDAQRTATFVIQPHSAPITFGAYWAAGSSTVTSSYQDFGLSLFRMHNRALSADEVRAAYNGQAVGYEHRGASQTAIHSATFTGDDNYDGWDGYTGGSAWGGSGGPGLSNTGGANALTLTASAANQVARQDTSQPINSNSNFLEGRYDKVIRITYTASSITGSPSFATHDGTNIVAYPSADIVSGSATITAGTNTFEYIHRQRPYHILYIRSNASTDVLTIDDISVTQIGCVAEYLPESISDNSWLDTSGNELDGSVSGATAVNAEAGIVARDSHLVESKTVNDLQSGASFSFPSVDGNRIAVGSDSSLGNIWASGGTVSGWINPKSEGSNPSGTIMSTMSNSGTADGWAMTTGDESGGYLRIRLITFWASGGNYWRTPVNVPINQWTYFSVTLDASLASNEAVFYLNGVAQPLDRYGDTGVAPIDDDTPNGLSIGDYPAGTKYPFDGQISQVRLHNRALTADEVRASYNGQAVGFEHRGASQDELVTNGAFAADTDWTKGTGWSIGSGVATCNGTQSSQSNLSQSLPTNAKIVGKKYLFSYKVTAYTTGTIRADYGGTLGDEVTPVAGTTYTNVFTYSAGASLFLAAQSTFIGSIDNVSVTQIGCVAEYLPESISDSTWLDSSGNELDGSVSGATAVNAEAGIVARDSHLLESKTVADLQSGASFKFDGATTSINESVITTSTVVTGDSARTLEGWVKYNVTTSAVTTQPIPFSLGTIASNNQSFGVGLNTNGTTVHVFGHSGTYDETLSVSHSLLDGEWHHLVVTYTPLDGGTNPTLKVYADGLLIKTQERGASEAYSTSTGLIIGDWVNSDRPWHGDVSSVRVHNRALSAAEVRASYNGQAVPYEYVGGSQDELITDGDMETAGSWSVQTGWDVDSTTSDAAHYDKTTNAKYLSQNVTITKGKRYRFKVVFSSGTHNDAKVAFANQSDSQLFEAVDVIASGTGVSLYSGQIFTFLNAGTYIIEGVAMVDATALRVLGYTASSAAFDIGEISLTQIGCVAEYLPSGINATQWVDTSGNNLHGTTSTATAVNHTTGTLTLESGAMLRMQDGAGLHFGSYSGVSHVAGTPQTNVFDDYEVGVWTPEIRGTTTNPTAANQAHGKYTKIGRLVTVDFYISFPAGATAGSGSAVLYGLPYNVSSSGYQGQQGIIAYGNYFGTASGAPRFLYAAQGGATAYLKVANSDVGNKTIYPTSDCDAADIGGANSCYFSGCLTYRVSD